VLGSHPQSPDRTAPTALRPAKTTILLLGLLAALIAPATAQGLPRDFFGIAPQTHLTEADASYMRAGRIGSVRWPFDWGSIQPTPNGGYQWGAIDEVVAVAARAGLRVFPFLYSSPRWLTRKPTTMPIDGARARGAWAAFVTAAVKRYGPGGEFWAERAPGVVQYVPAISTPLPIRTWQVWNEANFFYFAYPVSPSRYARLLKLTQPAVKAADPRAKVILSGLFGDPDERGKRGMDAADFLDALYHSPGIKSRFDAVALHPYAFHVEDLEALTEEMRAVVRENHDEGAGFYITEMGWGSQNDSKIVAFEQGIRGQARELRGAYRYLIDNRRRLNLKGAYWFSWKDIPGACNFCDSVGLFRAGQRFKAKPAWRAFVNLSGGRARP